MQMRRAFSHLHINLHSMNSIITGASRGLGFAMAEALAAHGAHVIVNARDPAAVEEAAGRIGGEPMPFDVSDGPATLAAMEGIGIDLGRGPLVDGALASGRLVEPFDLRVVSTHAYWLIYPESSRDLPAFQAFRQWLFDELPTLTSG